MIDDLRGLNKAHVEGGEIFDFPEVVDNTMRCDFVACERKFFYRHILRRVGHSESIHLVAGKALAEANDVVRKSYWGEKVDWETALCRGLVAFFREYGYDAEREADPEWCNHAKSAERMAEAFLEYWKEYHPKSTPGGDMFVDSDGTVGTELPFEIELDVKHPVTGKPLMYHGRCDAMENFQGGLWLVDDKTTGSLGASWAAQWDTRSQFMGYAYAFRKKGYPIAGVIARGVGILKTKITHAQVPVSCPPHLLERWWVQVNADFARAVAAWKARNFGYNYSDACNSFGKCDYSDACIGKFSHKVLAMMPIRVWNPKDPAGSVTVQP